MKRERLIRRILAVAVIGTTVPLTSGCEARPELAESIGSVLILAHGDDDHIAVDELRRALESEHILVDELPVDSDLSTDLITKALEGAGTPAQAEPRGIVALGHGTSIAWGALETLGPRLHSAVFVGSPAKRNLAPKNLQDTPLLAIHSSADRQTVDAHESAHAALAIAKVPHEMVVYDEVGAEFFDPGSADWDSNYWRDSLKRITSWLRVSFTTDDLLDVQ